MQSLKGAALESRQQSIRKMLDYGLLRDNEGRKMVRLEYEDVERRLKERNYERDERG